MTPEGPSQELHVAPGAVRVPLPEAPTTGYLWVLDHVPEGVTLVRTEYVGPAAGKAGGEGERIFVLEVLSEGRHVLQFQLARGPGSEVVETRTVTLIAVAA